MPHAKWTHLLRMPNVQKSFCGRSTGVSIDSSVIRPQVAADVYPTLRLGHVKEHLVQNFFEYTTYGVLFKWSVTFLASSVFIWKLTMPLFRRVLLHTTEKFLICSKNEKRDMVTVIYECNIEILSSIYSIYLYLVTKLLSNKHYLFDPAAG